MRHLPLVLLLALAACAPRKALKEGEALEAAGQDWAAAQRYVEVLDNKPGHAKLTAALVEVAPAAWEQEIARAQAAEDEESWEQARRHYEALLGFAQRATGHGVADLDAAWAEQKLAEMTQLAAQRRYDWARGLEAKRQWAEAIAAYGDANALVPGFEDATQRVAICHNAWAVELAEAADWRGAVTHFGLAAGGGVEGAAASQAGLLFALGQHHIAAGTCRQAVKDLRAADALSADPAVDERLAAAVTCATHPVGVRAARDKMEDRLGDQVRERFGVDRQAEAVELVDDAFRERLISGASEFLPVIDARKFKPSKQARTLDDAVDHITRLQVTELAYGRELRERTKRRGVGQREVPCGDRVCVEDFDVDWFEYEKTHWAEAELTLMITRSADQVELVSEGREARLESEARWADEFQIGEQPVRVGWELEGGAVVMPPEVMALFEAPREPMDPWDLAKQTAEALGADAAGRVLQVLDAEPAWEDPGVLVWEGLE